MSARKPVTSKARAEANQYSFFLPSPPSMNPADYPVRPPVAGRWLPYVWRDRLRRARRRHRGLRCAEPMIDEAELVALYAAQDGRCRVSGMPFSLVELGGGGASTLCTEPRPDRPGQGLWLDECADSALGS